MDSVVLLRQYPGRLQKIPHFTASTADTATLRQLYLKLVREVSSTIKVNLLQLTLHSDLIGEVAVLLDFLAKKDIFVSENLFLDKDLFLSVAVLMKHSSHRLQKIPFSLHTLEPEFQKKQLLLKLVLVHCLLSEHLLKLRQTSTQFQYLHHCSMYLVLLVLLRQIIIIPVVERSRSILMTQRLTIEITDHLLVMSMPNMDLLVVNSILLVNLMRHLHNHTLVLAMQLSLESLILIEQEIM